MCVTSLSEAAPRTGGGPLVDESPPRRRVLEHCEGGSKVGLQLH